MNEYDESDTCCLDGFGYDLRALSATPDEIRTRRAVSRRLLAIKNRAREMAYRPDCELSDSDKHKAVVDYLHPREYERMEPDPRYLKGIARMVFDRLQQECPSLEVRLELVERLDQPLPVKSLAIVLDWSKTDDSLLDAGMDDYYNRDCDGS